jgi:hypothetical protein
MGAGKRSVEQMTPYRCFKVKRGERRYWKRIASKLMRRLGKDAENPPRRLPLRGYDN